MHSAERFGPVDRALRSLVGAWRRLDISLAATLAFAAGVAALGVNAFVFGGVTEDVTQHNGAWSTDSPHLHWFIEHRSSTVDSIARILTAIGSPAVLVAVVLVTAAVLWWRGQKLLIALVPVAALTIAAASAAVIKVLVDRSRPPVALHLVAESDASFPSGHATDATAVLVSIALVAAVFVVHRPLLRMTVVAASGVIAVAIGVSRLVLGVHWPTDIVAGWALGASIALLVTLVASIAVRALTREPHPDDNRVRDRLVRVMTRERQSGLLRAA